MLCPDDVTLLAAGHSCCSLLKILEFASNFRRISALAAAADCLHCWIPPLSASADTFQLITRDKT